MTTLGEKDHPELNEVGQDVRTSEVDVDASGAQSSAKTGVVDDLRDPDVGKSDEERARLDRALVWKIDRWLIPWLSFLYLLSFLDRTNIGNARAANMEPDLGMTGRDYNNALTIFFVSYALAEPITNVLLKWATPRIFFTAIIFGWGVVMTLMGTVENQAGLLACRWFLGLTEAGLFPGVNYYLSAWYKRNELGLRAALFFSAAALAGSFGGLLAAAISQMDGVGGYEGWRWIFIIEGLITVFAGVFCWWMVFDFPSDANARFLDEDEKLRVLRRLRADGQSSAETERLSSKYIFAALRDWKTYLYAVIYAGCLCPLYSFSLFLPTILLGLGYTGTTVQLLSVPPYAAAALLTVATGWLADRTGKRGFCNMAVATLGCVGFAMLLGSTNLAVNYTGTFLAAMGIYPTVANSLSWCNNNIEGVYKRGVVGGIVVGFGNLQGVVSSNIYFAEPGEDNPRYFVGHGVVFAYLSVFLLGGSIAMHFLLERENKKRKAGQRDHWMEGKSAEQVRMMGDVRPDFMYVT
ncbi:hypothetical protein MBLNU230_g3953t1 [Neophaeotheca triangularis]